MYDGLVHIAANDGLVHIAGWDGLVHSPDGILASPAGHFEASPAGHVIIPVPPGDAVLHVIQEGFLGHIINEMV